MKKFIFVIALLSLIAAGCGNTNQALVNQPTANINQVPVNQPTVTQMNVSFLVSPDVYTKYCDGANMDSEGYRKSIAKQVTKILPGTNFTQNELVNKIIVLASEESNLTSVTSMDQNFIKIVDDTAYIKPIEGWAGVSIFLCAWKPLVETNILYLTNIKNVVWMNDLGKWNELNK
jgi:hypothetical protein